MPSPSASGTRARRRPALTVRDVYRAAAVRQGRLRPAAAHAADRAAVPDARFRPGSRLLRRGDRRKRRPEQVERAGACRRAHRTDGRDAGSGLPQAGRTRRAHRCSSRAAPRIHAGRLGSGYDRSKSVCSSRRLPWARRACRCADGARLSIPSLQSVHLATGGDPTCRSPAMFTGLIEAVGDVVAVEQRPGAAAALRSSADLAESLQRRATALPSTASA